MEETKLKYALLVEVVRQGGFRIPIVMRFSAIPGHCASTSFSFFFLFLLPVAVSWWGYADTGWTGAGQC